MAAFRLPLLLFLLPTAWVLYSWYCLLKDYLIARKTGIPLVVIPISHENPIWMIVDKKIFVPLFQSHPFGFGSFIRYNWRGWEFANKNRPHLEMGDVFVVVTPVRNWLYFCNAEALVDVFQRRTDFPRPLEYVTTCIVSQVADIDRNGEHLRPQSLDRESDPPYNAVHCLIT